MFLKGLALKPGKFAYKTDERADKIVEKPQKNKI